MHRTTRQMALCGILVLALPMLAGCPDPQGRQLTGSGMDMFAPLTMRVHPLSRIVVPQPAAATATATEPAAGKAGAGDGEDSPELEARIEFTDQFGDITKGVGIAHLSLYEHALALPGNKGAKVGSWDVDLTTPADNKSRWDWVTRTYLFRFGLSDPRFAVIGSRYVLSATMTFPNATQLQADTVVTVVTGK